MVTKKNLSEALREMFNTVSRSFRVHLVRRSDRYGYLLCAGNAEYFIPDNSENDLELTHFKELLYKPRRVKHPTVGGLKRYLDYLRKRAFKNPKEFLSDCPCEKENVPLKNYHPDGIDYDLTDDGTGKKYDNGKPMAGTLTDVFSRALMAVGACIEYGTHKYPDPKNWQLVDNGIKRYRDAMVRHLLKYNAGIDKDEETKLPHLAHMAWNALAILELYMQKHKDELDKEIFK
jgi:hypothetical protein